MPAPLGAGAAGAGYQIGTVAGMTGLDPHTIRAWERRYGAVRPGRTPGGTRLYDDADVARLRLLRALSACGEPIRALARLPDDALRRRLERIGEAAGPAAPAAAPRERVRVAVLGRGIAAQMDAQRDRLGRLALHASADEVRPFAEQLRVRGADAAVIQLERLGAEPARQLAAIRAASGPIPAVVVYQYAPRASLAKLVRVGAKLVRGPLRIEHLARVVLDLLAVDEARRRSGQGILGRALDAPDAEPVAPRFDATQLAQLAETVSALGCECPNHLSTLVTSLVAFESYARACESRDPRDAELHRRLARGTGHARVLMEDLLAELCAREGIPV